MRFPLLVVGFWMVAFGARADEPTQLEVAPSVIEREPDEEAVAASITPPGPAIAPSAIEHEPDELEAPVITEPPPPPPEPVRVHGSVRVQAAIDYAILSVNATGFRIDGALRLDRWHVSLGGFLFPERKIEDEFGRGGVFNLAGAQLRGGYGFLWGSVNVELDAGFDLGAMIARSVGLSTSNSMTNFWGAFVVGVGFAQKVWDRISMRFDAEAVVPLQTYSFSIESWNVAQSTRIGFRGYGGIEVALP